jgi:hypothetical protein
MEVKNTAWLEPICSVIRVGKEGAGHFDSYHFSATVRYKEIDSVEIVGLAKSGTEAGISKADWVAIIECFKQVGVKTIFYKRVKNGTIREKCVKLNKGNLNG